MFQIPLLKLVSAFALVAMLLSFGGCVDSPAPGPQRLLPQTLTIATPEHSSWMLPEARSEDLLYVAYEIPFHGQIVAYSYPSRKLVGTIGSSGYAYGACVDRANNVWFVEDGFGIVEYAHGGSYPIATLRHSHPGMFGCAVNPITGDLAVTENSYGHGNVAIYRRARGKPTTYIAAGMSGYNYCDYDNQGDLFVDGVTASGSFHFVELPRGRSTFINIAMNHNIVNPGQVQWNGTHEAIGSMTGASIYQFAISGSSGFLEGTTVLGAQEVQDFVIQGSTIIASNYTGHSGSVMFYKYPAGGSSTFAIKRGAGFPKGLVLSLAPH